MRYWILVALLNGLFTLVIHYAAPEMFGSTAYYAGVAICALIALVITWRDPPGMLDNVLLFLLKWGIVASGLAFFIWGIGYKLEFWGDHNPDEIGGAERCSASGQWLGVLEAKVTNYTPACGQESKKSGYACGITALLYGPHAL